MSSLWNGLQELIGSVLSFFYDLVPNMGISIVLLTILIGLLLFPLTLKQTRSMKAMQEMQPELKRLQKEYKQDRQRLQEETMKLYKERNVNPAAGCLPLILQMPIWFALFSVLRNPLRWVPEGSSLGEAIERGNTDFLWMDLTIRPNEAVSAGILDALPYLIAVILVVLTAFYQQKQTMAKSTQQQQPGMAAMTKIFPLFFGFISFSLPAGLVVYFAASQIFRIGQQALILSMDESHATDDAPEATSTEPVSKPTKVEPEAKPQPLATPSRQPQGSKKRRGKKRRRR